MRCQYHGWEYAASGKPCKIPSPKSFVPFPKKTIGLPVYAVESVGDLVFVRLEREGISLENQLGSLYSLCRDRFSRPWAGFLEKHLDYPSNWKVAVENSLEAYHVPCVHPLSFGADPGESRSLHILEPGYTGFRTNLPFAHRRIDELFQRCENWVARRLESTASGEYWHYHVFPNLLFAITDTSSFFQSVLPQGPGSSKAIVVQFGLSGSTAGQRALGSVWGRLKASLTRQIVEEDQALFSAVQSGLEASSQQGLLGRCEERIHAFQSYLQRACPP
jgi:phenylpropionate dioxygenase-like ring-hydroxylating dioxygenase large terminal subunit